MWRHNDDIGRNEYLIFTLSESTIPRVYSLQFLFKSTHHTWRYERKCEWVFFSEHSVLYVITNVDKDRHTKTKTQRSIREGETTGMYQHCTYINNIKSMEHNEIC